MDDLYDNLENYEEEHTLEELRKENKDLKCKLEEYKSTLEKLQNDFNMLSSEFTKLQTNYSSLLKTAKTEIERKTQLITNLNLEKDKLVLNSLQNRNTSYMRRRVQETPWASHNPEKNTLSINVGGKNNSTERHEERASENLTNLQNKMQNISNSGKDQSPKLNVSKQKSSNSTSAIKENIILLKPNQDKKSASILNRRKSMPAERLEIQEVSSEEGEMTSTGSTKEFPERRRMDIKSDRLSAKLTGVSSQEERYSGLHEPYQDTHRSRYSRYDDRYKQRDKSLHRLKRHDSPDRYKRQSNDFRDDNLRYETDRRRAVKSPFNDRHSHRYSHESRHHDNYHQNSDRFHHRQERYPTKHKISQVHDEPSSKRLKTELQQAYHHHNDEQKWQNQKDGVMKIHNSESLDNHFTSCESPDYTNPEASSVHQIREIKLTAATKLDDPRATNKKYVVQPNNGKVTLSTVEGRNIDMIPINKLMWGIKPVSMPEALVRRPLSPLRKSFGGDIHIKLHNISEVSDIHHKAENVQLHNTNDADVERLLKKDEKVNNTLKKSSKFECDLEVHKPNDTNVETLLKRYDKVYDTIKESGESNHYAENVKLYDSKNDNVENSLNCDEKEYDTPIGSGTASQNPGNSEICKSQNTNDPNVEKLLKNVEIIHSPLEPSKTELITEPLIVHQSKKTQVDIIPKKEEKNKGLHKDENKIDENLSNNTKHYKIPKLGKGQIKCNDTSPSIKQKDDVIHLENNKNKSNAFKCDNNLTESKSNPTKNNFINDLPSFEDDITMRPKDPQEAIEFDLELSDDTCDNSEPQPSDKKHIGMESIGIDNNIKRQRYASKIIIKCDESPKSREREFENNKNHENPTLEVLCHPHTDSSKKAKNKRRTKIKASKDLHQTKTLPQNNKTSTRRKDKQAKSKHMNSKLTELFGDNSSSLITPEDLGLMSVPTTSFIDSEKNDTFFEDAVDLNIVEEVDSTTSAKDSINDNIAENIHEQDSENKIKKVQCTKNDRKAIDEDVEIISDEIIEKPNKDVKYAGSQEVYNMDKEVDALKIFYQNLEPGIGLQDDNVVQTVIISTGVQPQCEGDVKVTADHDAQFRVSSQAVQNTTLQALATSTPHKTMQSVLTKPKIKDTSSNCNDDGPMASAENTQAVTDNSSNNTINSQINDDDVPDVRIFVKRKRKIRK